MGPLAEQRRTLLHLKSYLLPMALMALAERLPTDQLQLRCQLEQLQENLPSEEIAACLDP